MICEACGNYIDEDANFCPWCGAPTSDVPEGDPRRTGFEPPARPRTGRLRRFLERIGIAGEDRAAQAGIAYEPVSAQRLVPFETLLADGTIRLDEATYSVAIQFDDVNYQSIKADDQDVIIGQWQSFLDGLDANVSMQILLYSKPIDAHDFAVELALHDKPGDPAGNILRREFNAYIDTKLSATSRSMRRTRLLIFTVRATTHESAAREIALIAESVSRFFGQLQTTCKVLGAQERMDIISQFTRPDQVAGKFSPDDRSSSIGLRARDLVAPGRVLRTAEDELVVGGRYCKSFTVINYGKASSDKFLSKLNGLSYDIAVSMHVKPWAQQDAKAFVEQHYFVVSSEARQYMRSHTNPEKGEFADETNLPIRYLEDLAEAERLRDAVIVDEQHLFALTTVITVFADTKSELDLAVGEVRQILNQRSMNEIESWSALREDAFVATLPLGLQPLPYERNVTSEPLSYYIPFTSIEIMDPGGILLGINADTQNFIMYDQMQNEDTNCIIVGPPGGGKSFVDKLLTFQRDLRDDNARFINIDPEGERSAWVEARGGVNVIISETSADHINPFDITEFYGSSSADTISNPLPSKVLFLQRMMHMMCGELTTESKNVIDSACQQLYAPYLQSRDPKDIPTLVDFYAYVTRQVTGSSQADARHLGDLLESFATGTTDLFAHATNVDMTAKVINFDLSMLSSDLKPLAIVILLDFVWTSVTLNRYSGTRTYLGIDEFQLLLDDISGAAVKSFNSFWRRGRKWGLTNTAIAQNIDSLLKNPTTEDIIKNSPFTVLLKHDYNTAKLLQRQFHLSDAQANVLFTAQKGEGLYIIRHKVIHFNYVLDPDVCPALYRSCTSRFLDEALVEERPGDGSRLPQPPGDAGSLGALAITRKTQRILRAAGIEDLDGLLAHSEEELRAIEGMGTLRLRALIEDLAAHGLALADDGDTRIPDAMASEPASEEDDVGSVEGDIPGNDGIHSLPEAVPGAPSYPAPIHDGNGEDTPW